MIQEWVRISWHLGGMSLAEYLELPWHVRYLLHDEISEMIDRTQPPEQGQPKRKR